VTDDRSLSAYLGIGTAAAGVVIVCGGLGFAVDEGLDTVPIFLVVGLVVGVVGACSFVWTRFRDSLGDSRDSLGGPSKR
jgi:F0F1-type ATP synthase assembly protein I